ncbi:hypothetical protein [uncultured Robinsoniella sp.]|uniref:hypothetical protein n=1 Tax=uncultured Robinsoniella sp. TaxID=904190 RepID=UPI00374E9FF6
MTRKANNIVENSTIDIDGGTMKWDNHMVRLSYTEHLWKGKLTEEKFPIHYALLGVFISMASYHPVCMVLMLAAILIGGAVWTVWSLNIKNRKGVHLGLTSGEIYSFYAENSVFNSKIYELFSRLITENDDTTIYHINLSGEGSIMEELKKKEEVEAEEIAEPAPKKRISKENKGPLVSELNQLLDNCEHKGELNQENLKLIESTIGVAETNDREKMKVFFEQFIISGLINDCNELGLNTLINEIKSSVY